MPDQPTSNQTPRQILYIIVCTEALLALIGVSALALSLFYKTYADPAILTALIAITSGMVGSLGTLLTNTRQSTPAPAPNGSPPPPAPVTVKQPINEPIPVTTQPEKQP